MDINEIRMGNYKALINKFQARADQRGLANHGLLKRFGEFSGLSPKYMSHINHNRKNIGGVIARKLEAAFDMPHGWLDNIHENETRGEFGDEQKFMQALLLRAYRANQVETKVALLDVISQNSRPPKGLLAKAAARRRAIRLASKK